MKIIYLRSVLFLCLGITTSFVHPQQWQIAKHAGGSWLDESTSLAIDSACNTYIGGKYSYGAHFEGQTIGCNGYWDYFLAKYQSNGDLVWVRHGGGTGNTFDDLDVISEIKIHDQTQIYIGGVYTNQVSFGNSTLNSMGDYEAFIAKFDSTGDCLWGRSIGGVGREVIYGLELDEEGNIYIAGYSNFSPIIYFDTTSSLTMNGHFFFMAKYNSFGQLLWTRSIDGTGWLTINNITSVHNSFCLTGYYHGDITFDSVNLSTNKEIMPCVFLVDTAGKVLWGQSLEPKQKGSMKASYYTESGFLYCIGYAVDSLIIGTDTLGNGGGFLLKLDESGEPVWMRRTGYNPSSLAISSDERIFVTTFGTGTQIFGDCVATPSTGDGTLFIARLDSAGNCEGVLQVPNVLWVNQSVFDAQDRYYTAGACLATEFGNISLGNYGEADAFWAALDWVNGEEENNNRPEGELYIYANPNTGVFQLVVPEEARHEPSLTLNIYDNSGKVIHSQVLDMSEDPLQVDVSPAKAGMYHIQLISSRKTYSGKLVVY